jgi:hypothetical protein
VSIFNLLKTNLINSFSSVSASSTVRLARSIDRQDQVTASYVITVSKDVTIIVLGSTTALVAEIIPLSLHSSSLL